MVSQLCNLSTRVLCRSHNRTFSSPTRSNVRFRLHKTPAPSPLPVIIQRSTMSTETAAPKKFEWLVVIPDFPGVHSKRMEARPQHFAGLKPAMDSGLYQMGGAVLNEVPQGDDPSKFSFAGSTIVIVAESRDEIKEILKKDIYATSGVWDVENVGFYFLLLSPDHLTSWMACLLRLYVPIRRKCGRFCAHSGTP
ncbi:Protein YciI [Madurella mycetomatis]|uniref:Protein YciI n=1 Tax=Madurella mycetomatis TaxID=100816 RepID=A0A175WGC9_9PEZI|nr:Protein YciI [Madurella mycetomatis]